MSLRNGGWFWDRRDKVKDLIEKYKDDPALVEFLKDEKDRQCMKCESWQNGGSYDSGAMGQCRHDKISGPGHHPSNGCGMSEVTMVYVPDIPHGKSQEIWTRWNYSCALWERKSGE